VAPGKAADVIAMARRIRYRAALGNKVLIVIFSVDSLAEGEERGIGDNIYLTRPDNFNHAPARLNSALRRLAARR
jgi:hypothetical protein